MKKKHTLLAILGLAILLIVACNNQNNNNASVQFEKIHLFVGPYENCTIADLNLDGHPDIVYGPYWLSGPDFVPHAYRPNHVSKDYIRENSVHVYDVDKDGWPDIIVGAWGEEGIIWYKNPGNSAENKGEPWRMHDVWEHKTLSNTRGRMEMFVMHDYDGDNIPEMHSVNYQKEEPLEVFRFTDGDTAMVPFVLGSEGGGHGIAFGDVNNNGLEDVLCEIGWYERPEGDPFAQSWKLHRETDLSKMHPSCPFVVKDLNEDGRLDIIFGRSHDYGLYWWEQTKPEADGTTTWKEHLIDSTWSQVHALLLADIDGDGQDELIAGKCIWAHNDGDPGAADPPVVYYYKWNSDKLEFTRHTIADVDENIAFNRQPAVGDLNGNGRIDIVAPSKMGLWVFINKGIN
jgi:hypothetical protein